MKICVTLAPLPSAKLLLKHRINVLDIALLVNDIRTVHHRLKNCRKLVLFSPQHILRPLALGDVFSRAKAPDNPTVFISQQSIVPGNQSFAAVFPYDRILIILDRFSISCSKCIEYNSNIFTKVLRQEIIEPVFADHILFVVPKYLTTLFVYQAHLPVCIDHYKHNIRHIEVLLCQVSLLAQRSFRSLAHQGTRDVLARKPKQRDDVLVPRLLASNRIKPEEPAQFALKDHRHDDK